MSCSPPRSTSVAPSVFARRRGSRQRRPGGGVALGKPTSYPDELLVRIHDMHRDGLSLRQIAEALSAAGVTTAKGGGWYASSIRSVLNSERMAALVTA